MLAILFTLALAAPAAQEPDSPAAPPAAQEPVTPQQIQAAIEKVRERYDSADDRLRTGVEQPSPDAAARGEALQPAAEAIDELVAEMEALLELLPKPPS